MDLRSTIAPPGFYHTLTFNMSSNCFEVVEINGASYNKSIIATIGYGLREGEVFDEAFSAEFPDVSLDTQDGENKQTQWRIAMDPLKRLGLIAKAIYLPVGSAPSIDKQLDFLAIDEVAEAHSFLMSRGKSKSDEQTGSEASTSQLNQPDKGLNTESTSPNANVTE